MKSGKFTFLNARRSQFAMLTLCLLLGTAGIFLFRLVRAVKATGTPVSLAVINTAYTQNFDTLALSGTSSATPAGWGFIESGTNANTTYTAGTGSGNAGDTYSFGTAASAERAFGMLRSGTLIPIIGACFTNNTGSVINELQISYTGEQWRLGTLARADRIDFQYSVNAASLTTGTWTDVNALDFSGPISTGTVGLLNGNLAANRAVITGSITGLTIPNGATFFIRWTDFDATGADDGLSVDDFSLTPLTSGNPAGTGLAAPASVDAGAASLLTVNVTPGTNPASTGLAVTADLSAIGGSAAQPFYDNGTNGDVTAADNIFSFQATVGVLTTAGVKTLPVTITDAQSRAGAASITLTVLPPLLAIHQIQGNANLSPYNGTQVRTTGIVTAIKSNAFFIQTPDADADADPLTSQGVMVFTSSAPPATAAIGNLVSVTGTVLEFIPSADLNSPPLTELTSPAVTIVSSGNPLPAAITLTVANTNPAGGIDQLERLEGMRVFAASLTAVAPTSGSVSEANATSTSNGVFYAVITGLARPFREPGVEVPDPLPAGAPANVPRFDANPERLRVDSDGQVGAAKLEVTSGAIITNVTGVIDYSFRTYTILPDVAPVPTVVGNISAIAAPAGGADEFTIASFNTERFFDTVNDPGVSDAVLTPTAFNNRLNKISLTIRNVMGTPDIIGVQEMENLSTLQAVADKVNNDAVAAGDPNPLYLAYLEEGNDVGGIDVGFLVKTGGSRLSVVEVTQEGKTATYINPNNGQPELLNDRPSLVLRAVIHHPSGPAFPVTVINNHLRSLSGVDDPVDGNRVRTKRRAQAEFLASLIQARQTADPNEKIVSIGDYNAFQFNDGYGDSIGTIKGTPTLADQVVLASADLVNPDLIDLVDYAPAAERYSFSFDGNAQELDHTLITGNMLPRFAALRYARNNTDFPESLRGDATMSERISDHDPTIAYFSFPKADLAVTKSGSPSNVLSDTALTYTIAVGNTLDDAAQNVVVTDPLPANTAFQSVTAPYGWSCSAPSVGGTGTITCGAPSLAPQSTATITVVVKVNCSLPNGTIIANTATVASDTLDPDLANNTMTASVVVSNPPPVISGVSATPSSLWPPNHKMVDVAVNYAAADNCGPVSCSLSVTSNEPINGTGDGDTSPDWEIVNTNKVLLRAERAGTGNGRIYTITITCVDNAGGISTSSVTVTVPKNKSGN
ncbi:MAG: nuclease [Blastocatellia bacterium]